MYINKCLLGKTISYEKKIFFKLNVIVIKWQPKVFCAICPAIHSLANHCLENQPN